MPPSERMPSRNTRRETIHVPLRSFLRLIQRLERLKHRIMIYKRLRIFGEGCCNNWRDLSGWILFSNGREARDISYLSS